MTSYSPERCPLVHEQTRSSLKIKLQLEDFLLFLTLSSASILEVKYIELDLSFQIRGFQSQVEENTIMYFK